MRRFFKNKWVMRVRRGFRWMRIFVLLVLLAVLIGGIYVMHVGLPGFAKRPLLEELRARGFDVEVTRVRLHWFRGLLADQLTIAMPDLANPGMEGPPLLSIETAELRLNPEALRDLKLSIHS